MIRIEPTEEQQRTARVFLQSGSVANRGDFDGNYFQQLFGITAQIIVCDYLGIERPINHKGFDGGYDIEWQGKKWDVKCEIRNVFFKPNKFVHNVSGHQINYIADGFIFVSYNRAEGIFELCGYIEKNELKKTGTHYPKGSIRHRDDGTTLIVQGFNGMWEVAQKHLKHMKEEKP